MNAGRRMLCAVFSLLLFPVLVFAEPITLMWDPNPPEEGVTGYLVYYSQKENCRFLWSDSGERSSLAPTFTGYEVEIDVGNVTEYSIILPSKWMSYCFAAVAYNSLGLRSDYSEEILRLELPPDPVRKLRIK